MATLEGGSRYSNQVPSINSYIDTYIRDGLDYKVYFEDQDRVGVLPTEWIEIDISFGGQVRPVRTAPGSKLEVYTEVLLSINCYKDQTPYDESDNLYQLYLMVDKVRELFEINTVIPVQDYGTVGNPWAGSLQVEESPRVQEKPPERESGLKQVNISVTLMHHSVFG